MYNNDNYNSNNGGRGRGGGGWNGRGRGGGGGFRGSWGSRKPWFRNNWNNRNNNQNATNDSHEGEASEEQPNAARSFGGNGGNGGNKRPNFNRNFNSKKLYTGNAADSGPRYDDNDDTFDDESSNLFIFDATAKDEDIIVNSIDESCCFKMWNTYFPKERYKENNETHQTINAFTDFIRANGDLFNISKIKDDGCFNLDFKQLCADATLFIKLPNFTADFAERPQLYLSSLSLAMHQHIQDKSGQNNSRSSLNTSSLVDSSLLIGSNFQYKKTIPTIYARVFNYTPLTKIKLLKANMYDKFVSVIGTVVTVSNTKPFVTRLAFECATCNTTFQVILTEGKYKYPIRCANKACKGKAFNELRNHFMTKIVQWQKLKIQEVILDHKDSESGRIPRTIECELTDDLTSTCMPGDLVTVSGIVKAITNETTGAGRSNKDKCTFVLYIYVNSVQSMASADARESRKLNSKEVEFTEKDLQAFEEIRSDPSAFKMIVNSLCPSIFGHELVKAGLILGLVGGARKGSDNFSVRSDTHILVVGDPGLGKSQLLRACANVSPRGIYVCGSSTTSAGLTVSLTKDSSDDFSLEAGALLCAHNGTCCIDEFDKMGNQQQTLLEAMEQQCISIAKGGIVCTLPCRTTVLAAANPCGGHYDKAKTVSENLKLSGPLLSRFDLIFILLDRPDEEMDYRMSSHIISLHTNQTKDFSSLTKNFPSNNSNFSNSRKSMGDKTIMSNTTGMSLLEEPNENETTTLNEKLKLDAYELSQFDPIPAQILRKYIMYAKRTVEPVISSEAAEVLRNFYIHLRQTYHRSNGFNPITMRQLESLIRLTQARAKSELRDTCTATDAKEVIEIMKASMVDYYENELGELDFSRSLNGSGISKCSSIKELVNVLQQVSDRKKSNKFSYDDLKQIIQATKLSSKPVAGIIESLNHQCYLIKKGQNMFEFSSANF